MDTQPFFQDEGAGKKCLYPGPIGEDGDAEGFPLCSLPSSGRQQNSQCVVTARGRMQESPREQSPPKTVSGKPREGFLAVAEQS
jgi:hypothetical protein